MESGKITAYISLGSNLGDRAGNLLLGVRGLTEAGFVVHRLSGIYETEPVDVVSHDDYLNMVAEIHVMNMSPSQILARLLRIEYLLGRVRSIPKSPRTVDLDLLLFGKLVQNRESLTIPHPRMHLRNFVLIPMAEIAPHVVHPLLNQTIKELAVVSADPSSVRRWLPVKRETLTSNEFLF